MLEMCGVALAERNRRTRVSDLEFVGCDPVRVTAAEIEGPEWEGRRVEYWHAAGGIAWIARGPVSRYHEVPGRRLLAMVERICQARGAPARCFGSTDLRVRDEDGSLGDLMQADETVYLHPRSARLPQGAQLIVGEDDHPDVVLEVDNTTDVRRGKLVAYAEWGFPEVWVEVPDFGSPSRPRTLRPGLVIHVLEGGSCVESAVSRAFPTWRAEEIHRALNEPELSMETEAVLWRVGRALGEREGAVPEDDHLVRRMVGRGHARGVLKERAGFAAALLRRRGVEVSRGFPADLSREDRTALAAASHDDVVEAAARAGTQADFLPGLRG